MNNKLNETILVFPSLKIQGMSIKLNKDGVNRSELKWAQELKIGQSQLILLVFFYVMIIVLILYGDQF